MEADHIVNTLDCPYCCQQQACKGFEEILNRSGTGWLIYRYAGDAENVKYLSGTSRNVSSQQDTFIFCKLNNVKMKSDNLVTQQATLFDRKIFLCPRCQQKVERAQHLLNKNPSTGSTKIVGVCDHCFSRSQTQETCRKCEKTVQKFLATRDGWESEKNERWLINIEQELNKTITEIRAQNRARRVNSKIDLDLWKQDNSKVLTKYRVQELFHSDTSLLQTDSLEEVHRQKKHTLQLQKEVKFTESIESLKLADEKPHYHLRPQTSTDEDQGLTAGILHTKEIIDSTSQKEIDKLKDDEKTVPYDTGEFFESHLDNFEQGSRFVFPETLVNQTSTDEDQGLTAGILHAKEIIDSTSQKEIDKLKDDEKTVPSVTGEFLESPLDNFEQGSRIVFPETSVKQDTEIKQNVSSAELIKDTQEKIRLKAEEEENKIIEKQNIKAMQEEQKSLAREEIQRLSKSEGQLQSGGALATDKKVSASGQKYNTKKGDLESEDKLAPTKSREIDQITKAEKLQGKIIRKLDSESDIEKDSVEHKSKPQKGDFDEQDKQKDKQKGKQKQMEEFKESIPKTSDVNLQKGSLDKLGSELGKSKIETKLRKSSLDDAFNVKLTKTKSIKQDKIPKGSVLSKMLLDSSKKKEAPEEPIKKDDKPEPEPLKQESQEKHIKMGDVQLVNQNDNAILNLIKVLGKTREGKPRAPVLKPIQDMPELPKPRIEGTDIEVKTKESSIEDDGKQVLPLRKKRSKATRFRPPQREGQDVIPVYMCHEFLGLPEPVLPPEEPAPVTHVVKKVHPEMSKKKKEAAVVVDPEATKGVIRYTLSDRTFIEKGWTMLPVEKVVRKMNIYRMRPAQPEFDWFEHNKHKGQMSYSTGEKLAEFDKNGRGRWYYQNGRLALDYYETEETNTQQRFVVYGNGEPDERGRSRPVTILATFDHLGNGVVFDHAGKIRLKYNQTEGILLDRSVGPTASWKWHTLNDPPVLQQVMIDTQMSMKDPKILKLGGSGDIRTRPDNEEMIAIEFDNFIKEKSKKLTQTFKPFQIRMKALKINENFSLKVLDQATVYLIFRDGSANIKINIGMILDHKEIVDTDTAELGDVSNSLERFPARTDSLAALQRSVAFARRYERLRTERDCRLRHPECCLSVDELHKAKSRPLRPPLSLLSSSPTATTAADLCKCSKKQSSNLYYSTQLL